MSSGPVTPPATVAGQVRTATTFTMPTAVGVRYEGSELYKSDSISSDGIAEAGVALSRDCTRPGNLRDQVWSGIKFLIPEHIPYGQRPEFLAKAFARLEKEIPDLEDRVKFLYNGEEPAAWVNSLLRPASMSSSIAGAVGCPSNEIAQDGTRVSRRHVGYGTMPTSGQEFFGSLQTNVLYVGAAVLTAVAVRHYLMQTR